MDGLLHTIRARSEPKPADPDRLRYFELDKAKIVTAEIAVREPGWSLYGLDLEKRQAGFVYLPPHAETAAAAFSEQVQQTQAQRLLLVPFASLDRLAELARRPERIIHIFSMCRCGTTLVNWILNRVDGV